jgi:hypothetical protein
LKRGNAGLAFIEGSNLSFNFPAQSLNRQLNTAVSWQPKLEKAISQGGYGPFKKHVSDLIDCAYIKLSIRQLPLTGGHEMNPSVMGLIYVRGYGDHHLIVR